MASDKGHPGASRWQNYLGKHLVLPLNISAVRFNNGAIIGANTCAVSDTRAGSGQIDVARRINYSNMLLKFPTFLGSVDEYITFMLKLIKENFLKSWMHVLICGQ